MIATLFDHTATVYREDEARVGSFREVVRDHSPLAGAEDVKVALNLSGSGMEERGPGELPTHGGAAYGSAGLDVQVGDVLKITAGPNAPLVLEVTNVYRPRGHHTELSVKDWEGTLDD